MIRTRDVVAGLLCAVLTTTVPHRDGLLHASTRPTIVPPAPAARVALTRGAVTDALADECRESGLCGRAD